MPQHSLDCTHKKCVTSNKLLSCSILLKPKLSVILPVWYDLHVSSDSKSSESKRSICMEFLHAYIPIDMVHITQPISKMSESKDPSTWSFFMRLYHYDLHGSAKSRWYYHYYLTYF